MDKRVTEYPEAIRMYENGLSVADVAEFYGVTRQSMWAWLKRRAVKMRSQTRSGRENHFYRGGPTVDKRANLIVQRAIEKRLLVRPTACEKCGKVPQPMKNGRPGIDAHHDDYNRPLDVRWLCQTCHREWHRTNRPRCRSKTSTSS